MRRLLEGLVRGRNVIGGGVGLGGKFAEDDPINSKIMKKRLEKLGHTAYMTVNGEECSSAHGEQASTFDAVLMDLQVVPSLAAPSSCTDSVRCLSLMVTARPK